MIHHVLIVDDEEDIRNIIRLQLSGTRYEVLEAEGAEQAIERLKENALTVDVIICDIRMPKISGVEAIDYFLKNFPSTPVLVLTGFPDLDPAVELMKKGVLDYLVKPVEKEKLIGAVDNATKQRKIF
jgi:two-component system chemotaxis response regulator CheY